jgi:two-component system sensor histidine kinase DctS
MFITAVGGLLWFWHQTDIEKQRATLINDVLWLEQDLRFHLVRNEELLGQISATQLRSIASFHAFARPLLSNGTGLRQLIWLDPASRVQYAVPTAENNYLVGEEQDVVPSRQMQRLTRSLGRPVYSESYPIIEDDWQFEVHVPVFIEGRLAGSMVGIYSLRRLIDEAVPWWLAERYRIAVIENSGKELLARSKIAPTNHEASYQVGFEPPGRGLSLVAAPYQAPPPLIDRLLIFALVLLALGVLISLWLLRRHVQGRLAAEQALLEEYAFRRAMEDSMQTGLRARDLNGKILYVNPAFCQLVGWSADELVGCSPPMPYWDDETYEETRQIHDQILAGNAPMDGFELRFKRRNGELFTALIHEAPLIDSHGRQTGWMGSLIDITERKKSAEHAQQQQERLQATARLVAMGEMASSLAHELNQPLSAISSYCAGALNMLRNQAPADEVTPALVKAVEQTQRAAQIIRRVYGFVRHQGGGIERIPLGTRLDAAIALIEDALKRQDIRIRRLDDCNPEIEGDSVLIEQTLFNLLRNAGESMQHIEPSQRWIEIALEIEERYAHLRIADHGSGIPDELAPKLFSPLFTTKAEGMGMGLSICRSVIESHKGRIWFEANPQGGSIFHVRLPISEK